MPNGRIRHGIGVARDIQHRYSAIGGQTLAAGVTLYGFLALFALLVLAVAVLGFLSVRDTNLARDLADNLGLRGDAARIVTSSVRAAQRSRRLTTIVGVGGLVWLGTTWALAMASAYNAAWGVPGRGLRDRGRGLVWLLGAFALFGLSGLATAGWTLLPGLLAPLVIVISLAFDTAFWLWTARVLPNRAVDRRTLLGPAILGAVALEVLKIAGGYIVPKYIADSSELYGALGVVIALLLWLLVFGRLVVYLAVIEAGRGRSVVRDDPRAGTRG
jgi:membrane protein